MHSVANFYDIKISAQGLDAHDFNGLSDPYFVIKTPTNISTGESVFRTKNENTEKDKEEYASEDFVDLHAHGEILVLESEPRTGAVILRSPNVHVSKSHKHHENTKGYSELYESEVVHKNLCPQWQAFRIGLYELCKGNLNVEILLECYDWDRIGKSDFIGSVKIPVKNFISLRNETSFSILSKIGKVAGDVSIQTIPSDSNVVFCDFKAQAVNLKAKDGNGLSDPYFVIKAPLNIDECPSVFPGALTITCLDNVKLPIHHTEGYRCIYESPVILKNLNPKWPPFRLGYYDLCRAIPRATILIECYDYNKFLSHKLIGSAEVTLDKLLASNEPYPIPLLENNTNVGILYLQCQPNSNNQILSLSTNYNDPISPRKLLSSPISPFDT